MIVIVKMVFVVSKGTTDGNGMIFMIVVVITINNICLGSYTADTVERLMPSDAVH